MSITLFGFAMIQNRVKCIREYVEDEQKQNRRSRTVFVLLSDSNSAILGLRMVIVGCFPSDNEQFAWMR